VGGVVRGGTWVKYTPGNKRSASQRKKFGGVQLENKSGERKGISLMWAELGRKKRGVKGAE